MSLVEAATNVIAGYVIALITQLLLFPTLGLHLALVDNVIIAGVFTIISIVRSYVLRRIFEQLRVRSARNETAAQLGGGSSGSKDVGQSAMR